MNPLCCTFGKMPWKDKEKRREYGKKHYLANKDSYFEATRRSKKKRREARREYVLNLKKSQPCVDCGEEDPVVLQFDHVGDKEFNIADGVGQDISFTRLKKEIKKCEIVCANCHLKRTAQRRA